MDSKGDDSSQVVENSLGIPKAEFVEDVGKFMELQDKDAAALIRKADEDHHKYRFMEMNLENDAEMKTNFLLSDHVFMEAIVPPTDKICLWLGANVMLEYPLDEAESLLIKNLKMALKNLSQVDQDLNFLRDQITTTEVNMARIYNWDVKRRQAEKSALTAATS
ncbi:prefoldin subunit 3-like [Panonychus citri]|uniref:prefoldin subunit 3-like n=1 Tax=Panonychus citri TaxID=50023 RepID=UPI002306FBE6|nr:prefoldin subunit 3-like [Panonychus citri]